jgi:hypothetical protein
MDQRDSAFLTMLPPEIRNRSYELILEHSNLVNIVKHSRQDVFAEQFRDSDNPMMPRMPGKRRSCVNT